MKKLYVGNLPYKITEEDVRVLFEQYGNVHSVNLLVDRYTGKMRGFGFVEMDNAEEAIESLDGYSLEGRALRVNLAREKNDRTQRKQW